MWHECPVGNLTSVLSARLGEQGASFRFLGGDSAWYDKEHCLPPPPKMLSWGSCPLLLDKLKRDRDSRVATGGPLPAHLFL